MDLLDLHADINNALEGWQTNGRNVTAYDRLNNIKWGILGGSYGQGVSLDTLKGALEKHKGQPVDGSAQEFQPRWDERIEGFVENVQSSIDYLKG